MCTWQQVVWFYAGQESQECSVFTTDGIYRIYLSLTLGTTKFNQLY